MHHRPIKTGPSKYTICNFLCHIDRINLGCPIGQTEFLFLHVDISFLLWFKEMKLLGIYLSYLKDYLIQGC